MAGSLLNLRPWMVGLHLQAGPEQVLVIPSAYAGDNR